MKVMCRFYLVKVINSKICFYNYHVSLSIANGYADAYLVWKGICLWKCQPVLCVCRIFSVFHIMATMLRVIISADTHPLLDYRAARIHALPDTFLRCFFHLAAGLPAPWSPLQNKSASLIVSPPADRSAPTPFHLPDYASYIGKRSNSLTYDFIPNLIHQRNPKDSPLHRTLIDFKLVDEGWC